MKKRSKILAAAIALLGFSTAASITGTVAWFTAANTVSVSNMGIQAEAEEGIVIANETHAVAADWKTEVEASHDGKLDSTHYYSFIPTSTKDSSAWYHGNATNAGSYAGTATAFIVTDHSGASSTGLGTIDLNEGVSGAATNDKNIYLLNKFYIQASAATAIENQGLYVKSLSAERLTSTSTDLDKSLRILFKLGTGSAIVYAPLATGNTVVHDNTNTDGHGGYLPGTSTATTINKDASIDATDAYDKLWQGNIPAFAADGTGALELSVYLYFEGEDFNCKSANITNALDSLKVSFAIENK